LEGKTPLRTFAELGALFAAKQAGPTQAVSAQPQQGSPSQAVVDAPALTPAVSEPPAADQTPPAEIPTPAESGVSAP
jgi:hypothetical protein